VCYKKSGGALERSLGSSSKTFFGVIWQYQWVGGEKVWILDSFRSSAGAPKQPAILSFPAKREARLCCEYNSLAGPTLSRELQTRNKP
jgi:hypothetical protein